MTRPLNRLLLALETLLIPLVVTVRGAEPATDALEQFEKEVRPVLVERCSGCHGAKEQWAGLRFDSRAALLKGGDSGPAIVPGKSAESEIIRRVIEPDDDLRMPPADAGPRLSARQIAAIKQWIDAGAVWPKDEATALARTAAAQRNHWAFQPVVRPPLPDVPDTARIATPIDRFVVRQLNEQGLTLSPPADRRTLIRRVTYDLIGLPPTPEEVDAFVRDESPDAYANLVDRLLASPHYGERWARHWLDVARYSDTKGYVYAREERAFVHAHVYRDWVVRAFNADLPYDRFLVLQLAADQAAPNDPASLAAMGFLTLGRRFLGVQPDIIDDRIDVVTRGLMGLTVACARCHDHKYDPIPTADYYSLYGVFQNSCETMAPVPRRPDAAAPTAEYLAELQARQQKLAEALATKSAEASERVRQRVADYLFAQREIAKYPPDGFDQILGKDDLIPALVWRWHSYLTATARQDDAVFAPWLAFTALADEEFTAQAATVTQRLHAEKADALPARLAQAFATPPTSARDVADRYGQVFGAIDRAWRELVEAAKKEGSPVPVALPDAGDEMLRQALYGPASPAVIPDEPIVNTESYYDSGTVTELWRLQGEVDRWILQASESAPHAVILTDRETRIVPRIFRRGSPINRGDEVPLRFLSVLSGEDRRPFAHGSGRYELAQAIASRENPLTARVWVNRVWMHHFGAGLVRTPSDFGLRADTPSHPELLDWLADEFMATGWSTKALHRQILLSSTYRRRSTGPEEPAARQRATQLDPENRLLWRMNARRLGFEELRDSLVFVAGQLDATVGGRPVELFPAGDRFRRSIYGRIDRQFVPSVLRFFDFANPDLHAPQRSETTTPQQALFALNHPFVAGRAAALAERLQTIPGTEGRIVELFCRVLQREPDAAQMATFVSFLQSAAEEPPPPELPPATRAWSYGYGELDEAAGRLKGFTPLPFFNGSAWQGGPRWPDAKLGWVQLTAQGGHAGNDLRHAAIRRWTAPRDARIRVTSTLHHEVTAGDGVRGWIVSSRQGVLRQSVAHNTKVPFEIEMLDVAAGETLDFIVDFHANLNNDQFLWSPTIEVIGADDNEADVTQWSAERHFAGTPMTALDPWAQLAQVLLLSNEFLFVD